MPQNEEELLGYILNGIVDYPDEIVIRRVEDERGVCLFLKTAKADMGRVIGIDGETAKSIRSILRAHAFKANAGKISLKIEG